MNLVVTVCDQAAGEACPWFPGQRAKAHLGMRDPSRAQGNPEEIITAYEAAFTLLHARLSALLVLELEKNGGKNAARANFCHCAGLSRRKPFPNKVKGRKRAP